MANYYIAIIFALTSFQIFTFNYQLSGFRRTVINTPIQIFENSIPYHIDQDNKIIPYFDKKVLESSLNSYFKSNLHKYVNSYQMDLFYYSTSDGLFCKGEYCDGVKVRVTGKFMSLYTIEEKMFYEIKDNRL